MTKDEKIELLRNFTKSVAEHLIARSDRWPEEWDGHELRELVADAFDRERTTLMRESRKRRRAYRNDAIVKSLY